MMDTKERLKQYLSQCKDYIDYLRSTAFNEEPPIIMGGFARRAYMIMNDIEMTPSDLAHTFKGADVDFFWSSQMWDNGEYDSLKNKRYIDLSASQHSSLINDINAYVTETMTALLEKTYSFSQFIGFPYPNFTNNGYVSIHGPIPKFTITDKEYLKLTGEYTSTCVMLCSDQILRSYETLEDSFERVALTVQVSDECQHVFKYEDPIRLIDDFDIEASKFIITYPYSVDDIQKIGKVDDDDIYNINTIKLKDGYSPFRLLERTKKYSQYGFKFSKSVQDAIMDKALQSVDEADNVYDLRAIKGSDY